MVSEIVNSSSLGAIVETGTYRGVTTEWLSAFHIPIYSCELSEVNYGFSLSRLSDIDGISLLRMDSIAALNFLFSGPLASQSPTLFYLDAHWNDWLPLAEEIYLIFESMSEAIVIIDDFEVPDDPGYGYDDYGNGNSLTAAYIESAVSKFDLICRYPSAASHIETGAKRGCIVLSKASSIVDRTLSTLKSLRLK